METYIIAAFIIAIVIAFFVIKKKENFNQDVLVKLNDKKFKLFKDGDNVYKLFENGKIVIVKKKSFFYPHHSSNKHALQDPDPIHRIKLDNPTCKNCF